MLVLLFCTHFVADFLLQSREMGKKKSSEPEWLFKHLGIQFFAFLLVTSPFTHYAPWFALANAAIHGVIDWNIWRGYKVLAYWRLRKNAASEAMFNGNLNEPYEDRRNKVFARLQKDFQYWEDHWFYATIGFDQLLHGLTLILLAKYFL